MGSLFPDLTPIPAAAPSGFALTEDVLAPAEERALLTWARTLSVEPYLMHDTPSRRLVVAFGATYRLGQRRVDAAPFPAELKPLAARCAERAGLDPAALAQALVSHYPPGAGIGWHRDRPMYGPTVLGISLGAACRLRLRERARPRAAVTVEIPPRSLYVLSGPARAEWEHSIPPVRAERWSITLRTLR